MNIKSAAMIGFASAALFAHGADADPNPISSPMLLTANALWVATEKDVVGNWEMRNGELAWEITFNANHTLSVYHESIGGIGPYTSTWKLLSDHVVLDGRYVYHGSGSESAHYKPPPITFDYGNDLRFMRVNGNTVLLPSNNAVMAQKYGYAPFVCFWHYTLQYGLDTLPQDAIDRNKAAYKLIWDEQNKDKRDY